MEFQLYTGSWPNHHLVGMFKKIHDAMKYGIEKFPGTRMFINGDKGTIKMYCPFYKRWEIVNHK